MRALLRQTLIDGQIWSLVDVIVSASFYHLIYSHESSSSRRILHHKALYKLPEEVSNCQAHLEAARVPRIDIDTSPVVITVQLYCPARLPILRFFARHHLRSALSTFKLAWFWIPSSKSLHQAGPSETVDHRSEHRDGSLLRSASITPPPVVATPPRALRMSQPTRSASLTPQFCFNESALRGRPHACLLYCPSSHKGLKSFSMTMVLMAKNNSRGHEQSSCACPAVALTTPSPCI